MAAAPVPPSAHEQETDDAVRSGCGGLGGRGGNPGVHKDDESVAGEKNLGGDVNASVGKSKGEDSEVEKEAWKLLQGAVVTYCGNPVGTMAANDPGDKLPLNYDQVFIRDFIPSALAFLLRGESEIVKNFLLHTLQLQVIYLPPFRVT